MLRLPRNDEGLIESDYLMKMMPIALKHSTTLLPTEFDIYNSKYFEEMLYHLHLRGILTKEQYDNLPRLTASSDKDNTILALTLIQTAINEK